MFDYYHLNYFQYSKTLPQRKTPFLSIIIICLHTVSIICLFVHGVNYSYSIQIICTPLYGFKCSNPILIVFKQNYLTYRWDPNGYNHSKSEWT